MSRESRPVSLRKDKARRRKRRRRARRKIRERDGDGERQMVGAQIRKRRPGKTRRETRGAERDIRRRKRTIGRRDESSDTRVIEDMKIRGDNPGEEIGATRVRTGVAVPGRVVGVEITKDEGRRRRRREKGGTGVSHGRANRRRVDI